MFTQNRVIILRNSDLKRFFNFEEFWIQKQEFFKIVKEQSALLFFDSDKERECFYLFHAWCSQNGNIQAEIKGDVLHARVNTADKSYSLGRLSSLYKSSANSLSPKERLGLTCLYLMLDADNDASDLKVNYSLLHLVKDNNTGWENSDFIVKYDDWSIPHSDLAFPLTRKVVVNKSNHVINITTGSQIESLSSHECVIGLFTSNGCYRLLPRHLTSPDGGLQLRLIGGNNCADLELHSLSGVSKVLDVKSISLEPGKSVVYMNSDGDLICDDSCFEIQNKYKVFKRHYGETSLIAFENVNGKIIFYAKDKMPF